ncbi:MAG: D-2-hydroxyacid dehydrogenase [Sphaerochaetaceae bacterium]|nr:D-2-hydroxyacid dehydrogenase [Sphaerochaetaceae bacterium]MDC7247939.1 D-2-hydroxyacid dehydrogenase [Sphaerochaetaceae bacterium]
MNIVVLDGYTENPGDLSWEGFEKLGNLSVYDRTAASQILERIGDAEVVITNKVPITEQTFEACPSIRYVGVLATGFNVVDVAAAKAHGVVVTNIPTYGTAAVAQFAFALLLEVCHHVGHHSRTVQEGKWTQCPDFCYWDYPLIELAGKTMGIVGFGRIGQAVGKLANAFGMNVLAYDAYQNKELEHEMCSYEDLNTVLSESDIISLHAPLTKETEGMINRENIDRMKDGVIIINTSRGPLINEGDLKEALLSKKVLAAGLDVVSTEPIRSDNVLLGLDNCIITPHIAWAPKESRQRLMDIATDNLRSFLEGHAVNVVNS